MRYLVGFVPPSVRFNEVLPDNENILRELYPPELQNDPRNNFV